LSSLDCDRHGFRIFRISDFRSINHQPSTINSRHFSFQVSSLIPFRRVRSIGPSTINPQQSTPLIRVPLWLWPWLRLCPLCDHRVSAVSMTVSRSMAGRLSATKNFPCPAFHLQLWTLDFSPCPPPLPLFPPVKSVSIILLNPSFFCPHLSAKNFSPLWLFPLRCLCSL
jgi:hypothetical protein